MKALLRFFLAAASAVALTASGAAQVQPPGPLPLQGQPQLQSKPLVLTEAPSGTVLLPVMTGAANTPLRVRTSGGSGEVTVTMAVEGPNASRFSLIDPPPLTSVGGNTVITSQLPAQSAVAGVFDAPSVTRLVRVNGTGSVPASMPADHAVTITARDSRGSEVSRRFVVRFTRAAGRPAVQETASTKKQELVDTSAGYNRAQLEAVPTGEVVYVPYSIVTLRPSAGSKIEWHPLDPGSEVICIYGAFRYACDLENVVSPLEMPSQLTVRVPDIGRGKTVRVVLAGPYGESNPATATIDTMTTTTFQLYLDTATLGGKKRYHTAPVEMNTRLPGFGERVTCDKPYLVWNDLRIGDKVYFKAPPGGPPISLRFAGDAKARIVSVPRNQRITNNLSSWAELESDVPTGLTNTYVHDVTFVYSTLLGECDNRRR